MTGNTVLLCSQLYEIFDFCGITALCFFSSLFLHFAFHILWWNYFCLRAKVIFFFPHLLFPVIQVIISVVSFGFHFSISIFVDSRNFLAFVIKGIESDQNDFRRKALFKWKINAKWDYERKSLFMEIKEEKIKRILHTDMSKCA